MTPLLTIIILVFLVGVLIPKRPNDSSISYGASVKIPYLVFILALVSSPVTGALIRASLSQEDYAAGFLQYLWVGISISLPLSLITARMYGETNLSSYWKYLETFGGHSIAVIAYSWGFATVIAIGGALAIAIIPGTQ